MAARGSKSKEQITNILLKAFGDRAFLNGKELRLNWAEDGEPLQIAITLTMKKDFVESGYCTGSENCRREMRRSDRGRSRQDYRVHA